jgi:hypothetical protein
VLGPALAGVNRVVDHANHPTTALLLVFALYSVTVWSTTAICASSPAVVGWALFIVLALRKRPHDIVSEVGTLDFPAVGQIVQPPRSSRVIAPYAVGHALRCGVSGVFDCVEKRLIRVLRPELPAFLVTGLFSVVVSVGIGLHGVSVVTSHLLNRTGKKCTALL